MPYYDYKCPVCKTVREVKLHVDERPIIVCTCGVGMERLITIATPTHYKGNWFKTDGKYK